LRNVRKPSLGRVFAAGLAAVLVAVAAPGLARAGNQGDRDRPFVPQSLLDAATANKHQTFT
jgi:hypothetical protein